MIDVVMVWEVARERAGALREQLRTGDPHEICRMLDIDVIEVLMPAGVSGMIIKEKDRDARIFIDAADSQARRRFTCAHELGHFVERIDVANDDDFSFRDQRGAKYDLHEFFADEFAGELLMPGDEFMRLQDQIGMTGVAAHFGVSATAAEKRRARLRRNPPAALAR